MDEIASYQERLRRLAAELALSEERQRREIAEDLHDHLGQGLALLRQKLMELKGNAVFCGLDSTIDDMDRLLRQAIRYTRTLTFEISPPVLYELGLGAALEWLAEEFGERNRLEIRVRLTEMPDPSRWPSSLRVMFFKSVRELLLNVVKHARAQKVGITAGRAGEDFELSVEDDGIGFRDPGKAGRVTPETMEGYGLFSIHERLKLYSGALRIDQPEGGGARVTMALPMTALSEAVP